MCESKIKIYATSNNVLWLWFWSYYKRFTFSVHCSVTMYVENSETLMFIVLFSYSSHPSVPPFTWANLNFTVDGWTNESVKYFLDLKSCNIFNVYFAHIFIINDKYLKLYTFFFIKSTKTSLRMDNPSFDNLWLSLTNHKKSLTDHRIMSVQVVNQFARLWDHLVIWANTALLLANSSKWSALIGWYWQLEHPYRKIIAILMPHDLKHNPVGNGR